MCLRRLVLAVVTFLVPTACSRPSVDVHSSSQDVKTGQDAHVSTGEAAVDTFVEKAHQERARGLFEAFRPLVISGDGLATWETLRDDETWDPLALLQWPHLRAPGETVDSLTRDLGHIDTMRLEPRVAVLFRTGQSVLQRWQLAREEPSLERYDPGWELRSLAVVVEGLEHAAMRGAIAANRLSHLEALAQALATFDAPWPALALENLDAAVTLAGQLSQRLRTLSTAVRQLDQAAATERALSLLADKIENYQRKLSHVKSELATTPALAVGALVPIRRLGPLPQRLAQAGDAETWTSYFNAREMLAMDRPSLAKAANDSLDRLLNMQARTPIASATAQAKVDAARCLARWQALSAWRAGLGPSSAQLECERVAAILGERVVDDDTLALLLVDVGLTEPEAQAFRQSQELILSRTRGDVLPLAHRLFRRIMVLHASQQPAAGAAIDEAIRWLCQSATWISTPLVGQPATAQQTRLNATCAGRLPPRLPIASRAPHPLAGVGVAFIPEHPHQMAALDHFAWAPLGLGQVWATPPGVHPNRFAEMEAAARSDPQSPGIEAKIERFDGAEPSPSANSATR